MKIPTIMVNALKRMDKYKYATIEISNNTTAFTSDKEAKQTWVIKIGGDRWTFDSFEELHNFVEKLTYTDDWLKKALESVKGV